MPGSDQRSARQQGDIEFFRKLPSQGAFDGFTRLQLPAREFPIPTEMSVLLSLTHKNLALVVENRGCRNVHEHIFHRQFSGSNPHFSPEAQKRAKKLARLVIHAGQVRYSALILT